MNKLRGSNSLKQIILSRYKSPVGELAIGVYDGLLCICDWTISARHQRNISRICRYLRVACIEGESDGNRQAAKLLDAYFSGDVQTPEMPLLPCGTDFQQTVWQSLKEIPYGKVISYADQARMLGKESAVRAVASANAANAISIFLPCHRVVGSNGSLTGYAGGIDAKRYLLNLEARISHI